MAAMLLRVIFLGIICWFNNIHGKKEVHLYGYLSNHASRTGTAKKGSKRLKKSQCNVIENLYSASSKKSLKGCSLFKRAIVI